MSEYHSALKPELEIDEELDSYETENGVVFVHDVSETWLKGLEGVDAVYCDPAWRDGYELFMKRAGRNNGSFEDYLLNLRLMVENLEVPTFMVIGKHMVDDLQPHDTFPIRQHGVQALAATWFLDDVHKVERNVETNFDLMQFVAERYGCILNPCCGYGNMVHAALRKGKRFIAFDVNPRCVYYVAKKFMGYNG